MHIPSSLNNKCIYQSIKKVCTYTPLSRKVYMHLLSMNTYILLKTSTHTLLSRKVYAYTQYKCIHPFIKLVYTDTTFQKVYKYSIKQIINTYQSPQEVCMNTLFKKLIYVHIKKGNYGLRPRKNPVISASFYLISCRYTHAPHSVPNPLAPAPAH